MKRRYLWLLTIVCSVVLIGLALVGNSRLWGQSADVQSSALADGNYVFRLELGGLAVADYSECFGLGSSNETEESIVQTTAGIMTKKKTSGVLEWHDITLKRTGPSGTAVWSWRRAMEDGNRGQATRDGSIVMYGAGSSQPLARWTFSKGWASSLTIEGSVEELTIVHEGLVLVGTTSGGGR